ncbi:MAG: biotin--[acetyl-CoA-carboxylase] ligase [Gammaproteobacteria bacterium]|nr:MAG: biotin--[acetyl-CoA-carboxylase] ligase [Gammaproteobacteria bacterium]
MNKDKALKFTSHLTPIIDLNVFNIIDSTSNYLLSNIKQYQLNDNRIVVAAAEVQTKGRGRIGRSWHSDLGSGLTFSMLRRFENGASVLTGLSLVIGVAIVRVLRSFSVNQINLKWPNDILYDNSKLGGVLVELRGKMIGPADAVIGIGINFNLPSSIRSIIQQNAIDLFQITGQHLDRNEIFGALLLELCSILSDFEVHGFSYFKDEWISYHAYHGKNVRLFLPHNSFVSGVVDGINDDGSICLLTSAGRNSYIVGDISMRLTD